MAFNPFHGFRKHKKKAFAILTIMCMFIFVLSSGLGGKADLLNMSFFGGRRGAGVTEVATLDGKKIDAQELRTVKERRQIANEYMRSLVFAAGEQLTTAIQARLKDLDPFAKQQIGQVLQFRQLLMGRPISSRQDLDLFFNLTQQGIDTVERVTRTMEAQKKDEDAEQLRRLRMMLQNDLRLIGRDMYFGGGWRRPEDLLDFLVWKWVADKRDINLTKDAVQDLIRQDTYGVNVEEASDKIAQGLMTRYKVNISNIQETLIDEYRVRIAQTAVLGAAPGLPDATPSYVTPYEFYKFFRDNRTTVRVNMLPQEAESFVSKVTEQPSESELRDLFTKYARDEADPSLERPGFKEGKKVKIDWLGTKADNPVLKKAALDQAKKDAEWAESVKKALYAPPPVSLAGILVRVGALAMVENPKLIEKRIDQAYDQYVSKERFTSWIHSSLLLFGVHDRSMYQPQVIASGVAELLAGGGTGSGPLAVTGAWSARAVNEELKERIRFGLLPMALSGPAPRNLFGVTDLMIPSPLARAAMGPMLRQEVTDLVVKEYLRMETTKFQEEMTKKAKDIKKPEVKKEIQTLIDDFAKKMGFTRGASAGFHDRFTLIDDPGLKSLKEAYRKDERNKSDPKGHFFGSTFFDDPANTFSAGMLYRPTWFESKDPSFESFTKPDDQFFLVWKTEEEAPRIRKFEEARADVERAWRLGKARDLAKKAAEEIQKELRDQTIRNLASLKDFAVKKKIEPIEIGPLSKLVEHPSFQPGQPTQYMRPSVPADKVNYPTLDFAEKIVDLRDKPIGETILLHDAPRNIYYVGVLTERSEPSDFAFQMTYARANGDPFGIGGGGDPLLKMFENDRRMKMVRETIDQLKVDAKLVVVPEGMKLFGGRDSGDSGGGEQPEEG
jgi:hypothetical protein